MAICPNKQHPAWQSLSSSVGEDLAYALWDKYEGNVPQEAIDAASTTPQVKIITSSPIQAESTETPKPIIPKQLKALRDWMNRIGVEIRQLDPSRYGGINGVASLTEKWIALAEGQEQALTEEAFHFGAAIVKQTNPSLYKEMLSSIGNYQIYRDVFNQYKSLPQYQKNGKPDIVKLKEEAIGKMLASIYEAGDANQEETLPHLQKAQSWFTQLVDWFKQLLGIAGYNPFTQSTVEEIITIPTEVAQEALSNAEEGEFLQLNAEPDDKAGELYNLVKTNRGHSIALVPETPTEKRHYLIDGAKKVFKSVTDRTKTYYEKIKGLMPKSEWKEIADKLKAEEGTKGHADMDHIIQTLTDPNTGYLLPNPIKDDAYVPETSQEMYDKLWDYVTQRLAQFPPETRFLSEVAIYDDIVEEAGTIDFLAIEPDGTATILDWKFQDLSDVQNGVSTLKKDVPWYKKEANNIQLKRYKEILTKVYGITKWSENTAAIPIAAKFAYRPIYESRGDINNYPVMVDIEIGDPNVQLITETALLPVLLTDASSGDPALDKILQKLRAAEKIIVGQLKKTSDEKERLSKKNQITLISKAVRHLQAQQSLEPMLDQADEFLNRIKGIIDEYNATLSKKDVKANQKEFNDFAIRIERAYVELAIYDKLDTETDHLFDAEDDPTKLRTAAVASRARAILHSLTNMTDKFVAKVGSENGIEEMLTAEVSIKGLTRLFTETSKLPTKALNLFSKLRNEAKNKADFKTSKENAQLLKIQEAYDKWAKGKGLNKSNYFSLLTKTNKRGETQLLDQYSAQFYEEGKKAAQTRDTAWVEENVDMDKFRARLKEAAANELSVVASTVSPEELQGEEVRIEKKYSLGKDGLGWYQYFLFRDYPKDKWFTDQWKELNVPANAPAKAFYDWIIKMNEKAFKAGYLPQGFSARTFLPFVPNSLIQKLVEGGGNPKALVDSFWKSITIDENTVGYGAYDENGQLKHTIPTYLLYSTKEGNSNLLFRNMGLYNQFINEYQQLSEMEGLALAIGRMERNKDSIATSFIGKPLFEHGQLKTIPGNESNANLYDAQLNALVYGEKYVQSERFDIILGNADHTFKAINKKIGINLFPDLEGRQISMNRSVDAINNAFQIKALGINPVPALSNRLGGFFQSLINSGEWFTKQDVLYGEADVLTKHLSGERGKKFIAALRYFMPFTENENRDVLKKLAGTWVDAQNIQDWLMIMMRSGDRGVQAQIFNALWNNMIVIDGKILNARKYYRESPEYAKRYTLSPATRKQMENAFDSEVKKLIDQYGVMKLSTVNEEGVLVIPGVERDSDTVHQARNLSQSLTRKTTGQMTDDEIRGYQQNLLTKSMMIFKNWIPGLADVRFGQYKYNDKTQAYEWGRIRTFMRYLMTDNVKALTNLVSTIKATEGGMTTLNKMYEEKKARYEKETGKTFNITREQFYDLTRQNLRQTIKDAILTLSLLLLYLLAKREAPDKDEDPMVKNWHKFMVKVVDKIKDELSFFYNPYSIDAIMNGSIFPSLSLITDGLNVFNHFMIELFGMAIEDEKLVEKNYVMKYLFKSMPVTSQISSWLPLFSPEAAKSYGIRMSSESRAGR